MGLKLAKALVALVLGQPFQPIGDLLVLVAQDWAVSVAGLTDLECTAGQRNTNPILRDRIHDHLSSQRRP